MSTAALASDSPNLRASSHIGYMPYLDGLRGLAVLAVIVYHAMPTALPGGFIGVDVFFVLSGFLITLLLLKEYDRAGRISLKNFYARRALRLLPALVLLLATYLLLSVLLSWNVTERLWDALLVICYSVNWTRAYELRVPKHLGHTWSLSIEEQFYLIWPLLLLCLLRYTSCRLKLARLIFCGALLAWLLRVGLYFGGSTPERVYNGLDTRADSLLLGCALGTFISCRTLSSSKQARETLRLVAGGALVGLALFLLHAHWWSSLTALLGLFLVPLLSLAVIASLMNSEQSLIRSVAEQPVIVWIGQLSYGLYLWHYFVFHVIRATTDFSDLQVLVVGSGISLAAASLSFYLLERPCLRLKKRFA